MIGAATTNLAADAFAKQDPTRAKHIIGSSLNYGAAGEGTWMTGHKVFLEALDQNAGAIDGKVHLDEFEAAILPWIAFSTIDLDRSASLSKDELKVLLWISDGIDTKEPSKQAIDKAISEMDVDKNGTIDRLEWVM